MISCFGRIQLFAILRTIAHQAALARGIRQASIWSGLPCPPPGESSLSKDQICASSVSCISRRVLYNYPYLGGPHINICTYTHNIIHSEVKTLVSQSCLTPWPHELQPARLPCPWSFPGKNTGVSGMAISSHRGSSQPRDWTQVSHTAGRLFTVWDTREEIHYIYTHM